MPTKLRLTKNCMSHSLEIMKMDSSKDSVHLANLTDSKMIGQVKKVTTMSTTVHMKREERSKFSLKPMPKTQLLNFTDLQFLVSQHQWKYPQVSHGQLS